MMLKHCSFYILITFAIVFNENTCFRVNAEKISDLRLCGDRNCQTLLSKARTLARHKPTDPAFLPFERGELISIYSKSAGSRQDLWGGELKGKRGYFPRSFVREYKVEYQNPQHIVETEHHVPLEERMRGSTENRQAPPNARTVQHGDRQPDRTDQEQTKQDLEVKLDESSRDSPEIQKKAVEEQKQTESEIEDETDIGDETELPDEEQEVEKPETVSPDGAEKPSDIKTESSEREIQKKEKSAETTESEDPTEVDETELSEEDTGSLEEGSEAGQGEYESGTSDGKDETETGKNVDESERTDDEVQKRNADHEQDIKETEGDIETDETELVGKEEEVVDGGEKDELEKQEDDLTVAKDMSSDSGKDDSKMDNTENQEAEKAVKKEEAAERESDETEADGEGSMFGSIWSDENQGKVSESDVDNHKISLGEHADFNPNPNINTGDHVDTLTKENVSTEDTTLHDQKNDGNVDSLLVDDSYTLGDGSDKREIDENLDKLKSDKQNLKKEGLTFSRSDSKHSVDFENSVKTDGVLLSKHVDIDREHRSPEDDSTKEYLESDPNKSGKILSDKENYNMHHLKDILKSSLPNGNDIHQYIIEHSVTESSEILGEMYPDKNEEVVKDTEAQDSVKEPEKSLNGGEIHSGTLPLTRENNVENVISETKLDNDRAVYNKQEIKNSIDTSLEDLFQKATMNHGTLRSKETTKGEIKFSQETSGDVKETDSNSVDQKSFKESENSDKVSFDTKEKQPETEDETSKTEDKRGKKIVVEESTSDRNLAKDADEEKTDALTKHANKSDHFVEDTREEDGSDIVNTDTVNINEEVSNSLNRDNRQTGANNDDTEEINNESINKVDGNRQNNIQAENETLLQHIDNEDVGDDFIKDDRKMLHKDQMFAEKQTELKFLEKQGSEAYDKTLEEIAPGQQILDSQDKDPRNTIDYQGKDEEDFMVMKEHKNDFKVEAKETTNGAVVGSFQKKDAESEDTAAADAILPDEKKVEAEYVKVSGKDDSSDSELVEKKMSDVKHEEKEPFIDTVTEEKTTTKQEEKDVEYVNNENEVKYEEMKVKEADEKAEEMLDLEKTLEAVAEGKSAEKDYVSKDDLKFIDDSGEIIQDELNKEQESLKGRQKPDTYVKEIGEHREEVSAKQTQSQDGGNVDQQKEGHVDLKTEHVNYKEELDEQKMMKIEQLASDMMSILATPTLSESSLQTSSYVEESKTVNEAQNTEMLDVGLSSEPVNVAKVKEESLVESVRQTTAEHIHTTVAVSQTPAGHPTGSLSDVKMGDQVKDSSGVVIDGTTFPANYFGEETVSEKRDATQDIVKTSAVMDKSLHTPAGDVKPTKLFDVPVDFEQTQVPQDIHQNIHTDNLIPPFDKQVEQRNTDMTRNILATETQKEEFTNQEIEHSGKVSVLQTSFGFASQSVEDTFTLPVDQVRVAAETEVVGNNETVSSDNVQDEVQPSLDQNAYTTDIFISRKPLSSEPTLSETTSDTDLHGQEVDKEEKPVDVGQKTTGQETDENNNDVINKVVDEDSAKHSDWTIFRDERHEDKSATIPSTGSPEEVDPFGADETLFSRKVPDSSLDEEGVQSEDSFMKMFEPYLKSLINMLPPALQSVLEQEPVGLSPTVTMLVTLISTNVLALLTCVGCLCKGEKKPAGRKDPIVVIRELEEKLFIATKEKENLEDDLLMKTKKLTDIQEELNSQQSTTGTVETDLKTIRLHNEALKKQLADVEEELADYKQEVTEKTQVVAYKDSELQAYLAEVHTLSQRAQDAEVALQKTTQGLGEKEEELRVSLQQVQSLSEQIQQLETSKQQLQDEAVDWSEKVKELTEQTEQYSTSAKRMQEDLAFKENELEVLRDCFLQVKAFQGEEEMKEETEESPDLKDKLKQMMDVSRVNASLRSVEEERDVLQNKLLIEIESRKELEDQVQLLKRKFEGNQTDKMKAERQCQEAQTKLEVLSKYFKEKEAELTRQLGEQEVLKNQNISKLQSSDSITQELSKENETYRQQIEDLKTEISKAERDFRSQIAANEKKAHENWLATRAAERELKESRHECGMLRQKLTDLERKLMQGPPPGLIRPITHRAMPPPGMLNGPPPPPPERPGSRGSVHGHVTPRLRDEEYRASPVGPDRIPPPDRRLPPGPMGPRPPPPPLDAMSPPPYAIRPPFPPDRRSPPSFDRYPPPRGPRPPFPRPPPPHLRSPPNVGSIPSEHDDSRQDPSSPYNRAHPGSRDRGTARHQSQV